MGSRSKRLYSIVFFSIVIIGVAIALFVVFVMPKYKTITFENSNIEAIRLKQGSVINELPEINETGYIFYGWYYSEDLSEESKVKLGEDLLTEDISLYPKLLKGTFTVSYNINGGEGNTPDEFTAEYQTPFVLPIASLAGIYKVDEQYGELNLKYWTTNADGTGDKYIPGDTIFVPGENITLYAFWYRKETKILFYPNGGEYVKELVLFTGEKVPEEERKIFVSRKGYWFEAWYFNEECTGDPVDFDELVLPEGILRLYAKWNPNQYIAKFYMDYDDYVKNATPYATQTIYYDGYVSAPEKPKKEDLYFLHWAVGINSVKSKYNFDKKVTGNVDLFAEWTTEIIVDNETDADCFEYAVIGNEVKITGLTEKGKSLSKIVIPKQIELKDVTIIGGINNNDKLTNVILPYTLAALGSDAFMNCPNIVGFDFTGPNDNYKVVDGVIFSKSGDKLYRYPASKQGSSYTVPTETLRIMPYAFNMSKNLETINIDCEMIDSYAFQGSTSIKSLILGSKVLYINENALRDINSLNYIEIENNEKFVVDNGILYETSVVNDERVKTTVIKCFNKTKDLRITLPNTVTEIASFAFQKCDNIVYLEFGENVTLYGEYCLYQLSSLTELKFNNASANGVTIKPPALLIEQGALTAVYAYENSYIWNELKKLDFVKDILVAI